MKRIFLICLCAVSALAVLAQNERPQSDIRILSTSYSWSFAWGGTWGGEKGVDNRALPATMAIDYVRVWQKKQE